MSWMLILLGAWAALAVLVALLVGSSIRLADRRSAAGSAGVLPDFVPAEWMPAGATP
jgi:uncharacterized RDD family membrane protein YckC